MAGGSALAVFYMRWGLRLSTGSSKLDQWIPFWKGGVYWGGVKKKKDGILQYIGEGPNQLL